MSEDSHMQVNIIAQFHLLMILFPVLQKTPTSRLVFQSSDLHRATPSSIKFESLGEINQDIGPSYLYNRSKLAQILVARALVRRLEKGELGSGMSKGPWINATHPGGVKTDQPQQAIDAYGSATKIAVKLMSPFMADPIEEGCRPALFAATADAIIQDEVQGQYIVPGRKISEPSSQAQEDALGEQLWKTMVGILETKLGSLPYKTQ